MKPRKPKSVELDAILTPEQFAEWFQVDKEEAIKNAQAGKIPYIPYGPRIMRFHPRSVLAATQENLPLPVLQRLKQGVI